MAKLGTLTLSGQSGTAYGFDVYPASATWQDGVECVYYISSRIVQDDGGSNHTAVYIGETDDLKTRLANHHKQDCFDRHRYNAISILQVRSANHRAQIEADLIDRISPPCNG